MLKLRTNSKAKEGKQNQQVAGKSRSKNHVATKDPLSKRIDQFALEWGKKNLEAMVKNYEEELRITESADAFIIQGQDQARSATREIEKESVEVTWKWTRRGSRTLVRKRGKEDIRDKTVDITKLFDLKFKICELGPEMCCCYHGEICDKVLIKQLGRAKSNSAPSVFSTDISSKKSTGNEAENVSGRGDEVSNSRLKKNLAENFDGKEIRELKSYGESKNSEKCLPRERKSVENLSHEQEPKIDSPNSEHPVTTLKPRSYSPIQETKRSLKILSTILSTLRHTLDLEKVPQAETSKITPAQLKALKLRREKMSKTKCDSSVQVIDSTNVIRSESAAAESISNSENRQQKNSSAESAEMEKQTKKERGRKKSSPLAKTEDESVPVSDSTNVIRSESAVAVSISNSEDRQLNDSSAENSEVEKQTKKERDRKKSSRRAKTSSLCTCISQQNGSSAESAEVEKQTKKERGRKKSSGRTKTKDNRVQDSDCTNVIRSESATAVSISNSEDRQQNDSSAESVEMEKQTKKERGRKNSSSLAKSEDKSVPVSDSTNVIRSESAPAEPISNSEDRQQNDSSAESAKLEKQTKKERGRKKSSPLAKTEDESGPVSDSTNVIRSESAAAESISNSEDRQQNDSSAESAEVEKQTKKERGPKNSSRRAKTSSLCTCIRRINDSE